MGGHPSQRRRIKTEEKANVVAAVRGTELIHFFAALTILHQDDLIVVFNENAFD